MAASPIDAMLSRLTEIDGFVFGCLVEATSGMVLGSVQAAEDVSTPVAAAGAVDVVSALSLMTAELALKGDLEDVMVTLSSHYYLLRLLPPRPGGQPVLLVALDRSQANLAMAHREIRDLADPFA